MGPTAVWIVEDDIVAFRKGIFEFLQNGLHRVWHRAEMDGYVLCLGH